MNIPLLSVNDLFKENISTITAADIPECGRHSDEESRVKFFSLEEIINSIGEMSTKAQGLKRIITTLEKLCLSPNHKLYILKDEKGNGQLQHADKIRASQPLCFKTLIIIIIISSLYVPTEGLGAYPKGDGEVIGILKIGEKKLFLYDRQGKLMISTPMCVLDFFVLDNRQRSGFGKKLFDYMLQDQKLKPYELAIDGPSPKMLDFLKKHYNFTKVIKQSNNFAVCEKFFESANMGTNRPQEQIAAISHTNFKNWDSEVGSVIHGGSSSSSNLSHKSNESEASISEADGETSEERWEVAAPPPAPKQESHDPSADTKISSKPPERPSTLTFECCNVVETEATVELSKTSDYSDSQLTDQGYVDLKFHHIKLW
ncbi:Alpha-tubulin N-acetyltransferase [Papilio machaon]|uniref:Alpha-tubulin N-acetyltransferase n=1 Tax=Papilio machaon TaxID=76193 RepID=A0A194QL78_PAPMA|nr:Alpha-tubulin N-acetyltransferase [Papilio machaon]